MSNSPVNRENPRKEFEVLSSRIERLYQFILSQQTLYQYWQNLGSPVEWPILIEDTDDPLFFYREKAPEYIAIWEAKIQKLRERRRGLVIDPYALLNLERNYSRREFARTHAYVWEHRKKSIVSLGEKIHLQRQLIAQQESKKQIPDYELLSTYLRQQAEIEDFFYLEGRAVEALVAETNRAPWYMKLWWRFTG